LGGIRRKVHRPVRRIVLQARILSIGHNLVRLRLRNAAIQKAGYHVVTTRETAIVLDLARKQNFDAIVICSSIPPHLREHIARELKRLRAIPPLIVICEGHEPDCFRGLAEEVVYVPHTGSQQPVIDAIGRVVGTKEEDQRKAL
jgi:DNA-binding NarL/FixJ family response regulator